MTVRTRTRIFFAIILILSGALTLLTTVSAMMLS
jgi:hypothetical protein